MPNKGITINFTKFLLQCDYLHAYLLDDSLLLFSEKSQFVYGFERENAALLLEIDSAISNNIPKEEIFHKYSRLPNNFIETLYSLISCNENVEKESYSPKIDTGSYSKDDKERIAYVIDDLTFFFHYPNNSIFEMVHPVIKHLKSDTLTSNIISVDFESISGKWQILFNNLKIATPTEVSRISLFLQDTMLIAFYQSKPYLISMHAATLEYKDSLFVFPAVSGSGKTTLSAALMNNNFHIYSDELSVIDNNGYISSLPFALSIKEGSWGILETNYPILSNIDFHIRFDNQKVKFLKPLQNSPKSKKPTHLIFPKYIKNSKTKIQSLSACDAMNRIKEAGYELDRPLNKDDFEKILDYLLSLPTYSLEYSSLEEAINLIKDLAK